MKIRKKLIFVFVLLTPFIILAQPGSGVDSLVTSGYQKIAFRNYAGSIMDFEAAIGLSPNHVPAIIGKINCLFFQNDVKDALKLIKKTIKKFPDNANLYYHSGMIYNTKKKYKKSINYFNIALDKETNTDNYNIYLNRGIAQYNLKIFELAIQDYSSAIELNPENHIPYYRRGLVYYAQENYDNAINDFGKSLEINPNNPAAYYNRGMAYYRIEDKMNACVEFQKSCEMGNKNACKMLLLECQESVENNLHYY